MQVPPYTAVKFLRGEIGLSTIIARDGKNKLSYLEYAMQAVNNDLKNIVQEEYDRKNNEWIKTTISRVCYGIMRARS